MTRMGTTIGTTFKKQHRHSGEYSHGAIGTGVIVRKGSLMNFHFLSLARQARQFVRTFFALISSGISGRNQVF